MKKIIRIAATSIVLIIAMNYTQNVFADDISDPDVNRYLTTINTEGGMRWGFIDKTGKCIIPAIFEDVEPFNQYGVAEVEINGYKALIDLQGKIITKQKYSDIYPFSESVAIAKINDESYEILNTKGEVIGVFKSGLIYKNSCFKDGIVVFTRCVEDKMVSGIINPFGTIIYKRKCWNMEYAAKGKLLVEDTKHSAKMLDFQGNELASYEGQNIYIKMIHGKIVLADTPTPNSMNKKKCEVKIIDSNNKTVKIYANTFIRPNNEGNLILSTDEKGNRKYQFFNSDFEPITKKCYEFFFYLGDGVYAVKEKRKVVPVKEDASREDLARSFSAAYDTNFSLLDTKRNTCTEEKYMKPSHIGDGYFSVKKGFYTIVVNSKGEQITALKFWGDDSIDKYGDIFVHNEDRQTTYYTADGKVLLTVGQKDKKPLIAGVLAVLGLTGTLAYRKTRKI